MHNSLAWMRVVVRGEAADEQILFRTRLRQAMPKPAKRLFRLASGLQSGTRAWLYDAVRFARYSGTFKRETNTTSRQAEITKFYHMIEKGLALPAPRPGFGKLATQSLCGKVQAALKDGMYGSEVRHAIDAIDGYRLFNERNAIINPPWITETLAFAAARGLHTRGKPIRRPSLPDAQSVEQRLDFITSRHSIRHFSEEPVPDDILKRAAAAAQSAPCVCNRQMSRVYFARDPEIRRAFLACQNGNRGFGESAPVIALITVDLRGFLDASERYQAWIDGGLFAMNLLLGIHAQGYGACALNWSALPAQDRKLRKLGIIVPSETVIMMVAVGALPEDYHVPRSERHALDDIMQML